jgi:hypothetical protein
MRRSSKELPNDANQLAYEIVRLSTEEPPERKSVVSEYLAKIGRKGGLKGGKARADKLSKKRRSEIAREAAKARWSDKTKH